MMVITEPFRSMRGLILPGSLTTEPALPTHLTAGLRSTPNQDLEG
jgi:hypothetical protein